MGDHQLYPKLLTFVVCKGIFSILCQTRDLFKNLLYWESLSSSHVLEFTRISYLFVSICKGNKLMSSYSALLTIVFPPLVESWSLMQLIRSVHWAGGRVLYNDAPALITVFFKVKQQCINIYFSCWLSLNTNIMLYNDLLHLRNPCFLFKSVVTLIYLV